MRTLSHCEIAHTTGAAGNVINIIGSTIVGGITGVLFNSAIHEIILNDYKISGGNLTLAAIELSTTVAPLVPYHVAAFAGLGFAISAAYALTRE